MILSFSYRHTQYSAVTRRELACKQALGHGNGRSNYARGYELNVSYAYLYLTAVVRDLPAIMGLVGLEFIARFF
jgi:hypothetical protein